MLKSLTKLTVFILGFTTLFLFNVKGVWAAPALPPPTSQPNTEVRCAGNTGINTAIGCIPVNNQEDFISFVLSWAIGIGGGIALILIAFSAFMIMTSTGNPDRLKAGQELLTSALSGLILLIFSIFVLRLIGVQVLNIPGF